MNAHDYLHRGDAHMQQQHYDLAVADYLKALSVTQKDIKLTVTLLLRLGNTYDALQYFQESIERYRQAIRLNAQNPESHYFLAGALAKSGQRQQAITEYTWTIRLDPEYVGAYLGRGNLLLLLDQQEEAQQDFEMVLDLTSQSLPAGMQWRQQA